MRCQEAFKRVLLPTCLSLGNTRVAFRKAAISIVYYCIVSMLS
jgi:hypothetical protein